MYDFLNYFVIVYYNFLFLISYLVKIVSGRPVLPLTCWKPPRVLYSVHAVQMLMHTFFVLCFLLKVRLILSKSFCTNM